MKPIDFAKAAGVAALILALSVIVSIIAVFAYSLMEPGHPKSFYDAAALRIAPWCSYIAGTAFCFAAGYLCGKRHPERNGYLFALVFILFFALIDGAVIGFAGIFALNFFLSILAKLLAALAGAFLARRRHSR